MEPNPLIIEQREPLVLQTIVVKKKGSRSMAKARKIAREFADKSMKTGDQTDTSFRFRVRSPGMFKDGSLRTKVINSDVSIVLGKLK